MLAYPLVNLAVILPLSTYRLASLAGKTGSPGMQAGCGVIFSLGGFANVILYSFTRVSCTSPSSMIKQAESLNAASLASPIIH